MRSLRVLTVILAALLSETQGRDLTWTKTKKSHKHHDVEVVGNIKETDTSIDEKDNTVSANSESPLVPSFCPSEPFEDYASLHHNIVEGKADQRYLVYRPYLYCGMGNRLSGFRGALGLAMMTDRALLVDWYGGVTGRSRTAHKYEDNFIEAHGVPHGDIPSDLEDYENMPGTEVWCQMENAVSISTPCDTDKMTPEFFVTGSWDEIYAAEAKVVIMQAHNGNPWLYLKDNANPEVVEAVAKQDDSFGAGVFGLCALRFLFQVKEDFRSRYCEERSGLVGGKFPSVSLHIRTGDNPNYHVESYKSLPQDVENFVACATGFDEGLASVAQGHDFDMPGEGLETVWLLGTDSEAAINLMKEGNHTVELGGKVAFIEGDEFHRIHSGSKGGKDSVNSGPLIDLAMLSEAPLLIGSYHSSFSINIAELGALPLPLRLVLKTPFASIFGSRQAKGMLSATAFDDYHQGCRDFILDPNLRGDLVFAVKASREPFIVCED